MLRANPAPPLRPMVSCLMPSRRSYLAWGLVCTIAHVGCDAALPSASDSAPSSNASKDPEPSSASPVASSPDRPTSGGSAGQEPTLPSLAPSEDNETRDGSLIPPPCLLSINTTLSEDIPTVGIVTVSSARPVESGFIEFGADTTYGTRAPVEPAAGFSRTLLLGLRANAEYHYRVSLQTESGLCVSEDQTLTTGHVPEEVPRPVVTVPSPERVASGFVITSPQAGSGGEGGGYMVIYDHTASPVWWYRSSIGGLVSRARLSWDGKYIYGRDANPSARPGGAVVRVAIDGSSEEKLTVDTGHHDMTLTPEDGVLFLVGGGGDDCGRIQRWTERDGISEFYDLRAAFGATFKPATDPCHCNSIHYNRTDASVTVSCLMQNAYVKISARGQLVWVLGGNNGQSHFTGDVNWSRQHGHHILGEDRILFFNNNGGGDANTNSSLAVELRLDVVNKTAQRVWEYDGGEVSQTLGDTQRLLNGNTLVTYCNAGILHEVDSEKNVVQVWKFGNGMGYSEHRPSLYDISPSP